MAQHWTRIILGLFTLFVYLSWPRKKVFPLIIATTLIEDMGTVLLIITRERNRGSRKATSFTEASRCSLISKATLRLLQYPEMAVKS